MRFWSDKISLVMYDLSITPFQNNTVSFCTPLPYYVVLLAWHPTRSLKQKLQRVKPCQTMLPWLLLLSLFYMHISVSSVTLSVPCYRTRARVITFLPVFPWRVTNNDIIMWMKTQVKIFLLYKEMDFIVSFELWNRNHKCHFRIAVWDFFDCY